LATCHHLLRIFSDYANRIPIQQELAFAAELFGNAPEADIEALIAQNNDGAAAGAVPCPFPFITTCLIVGASYNPEIGRCSSLDEEPFGMGYDQGHNNNGITVLDITDLSNIRYCFVDFYGMESDRAVPLHTPLDGWTYLRAYYDDTHDLVVNNKATTDGLEKYSLVELSALAGCWPDGNWQTAAGGGDSNLGLAHTRSDRTPMPSLRALSQKRLFQRLLSSDGPPDLTLLDQPMLFRDFTRDLQRYVIDNAGALSKSPAAVEILKKAFAGETAFDFTPFQGKLSANDLVALVSSEAMRNVKTANLSGFDSTTDMNTVAAVLEHLELESLYLLARPDRSTENVSETLDTLGKCPSQPLVRQRLVLGPAFSRSIRQNFWRPQIPTAVNPSYWKTFPVVQLLYQGPQVFNIFYEDEPWLTDFFLGDAFLTPIRFVTGLLRIIKGRFQDPEQAGMLRGEIDVPLAFACAPSSLKTFATSTEVSPIPAEAYRRSKREYHSSERTPRIPVRDLHPEGWTAVMVHTATKDRGTFAQVKDKARFRVALVRSKDRLVPVRDLKDRPCELEVVDLKGFLELTAPEHAGDLVTVLSELTAWAETGEDLVSKLAVEETISTLEAFAGRSADV
jgi:hypothetical protein